MPGAMIFEYLNVAKEVTKGTSLAPTRQLYFGGSGVLDVDPHLNFHENENRGQRTRISRATQQGIDINIKAATTDGIGYDNLPYLLSFLKGNITPSGAMADKTWDHTPSMSASNAPDSFTLDVGDDTQNYRVEYGMASQLRFHASRGDVLQAEATIFGRQSTKVAKATPAVNSSPMLPGDQFKLLTAATFAGLSAGTAQNNLLLDWDLTIDTGVRPRHYMDGTLYFGQHVETDIAFDLVLTVESQAVAVSQFYDKWMSQTLDFLRLQHTGAVLGASNYKAVFDMALLYSKVEPISSEEDGVNLYRVAAKGTFDPTSSKSISPVVTTALTTL